MANNGSKQEGSVVQELSIQQRVSNQASGVVVGTFWFGASTEDEIAPWWSEARDRDLRKFYLRPGNDILQGANSSMVKKFKAMNWVLEGPEQIVNNFQPVLAEAEFGQGWSTLIGKSLQDYNTQDKGTFWELVGRGNLAGPIEGPVLGIAHLDSGLCQVTGDPVYPVIFNNPKSNKPHKLHATRVIHMVDMPSPNEAMNNIGFCATSRVLSSSQVLMRLAKYKNEKLSDLPPAGLLLLSNIVPSQWQDAVENYDRERRRVGNEMWANIMEFFSVDPSQKAEAEFVSFAQLPDHFDEEKAINLYVNIVALSYGVDVREFWPMSAGPLGTAQETTIQHQKAKGKGVGDIISTIERAINWKILPPSVTFKFDFQDDEEDELQARINRDKIASIMQMWQPPNQNQVEVGFQAPVTRMEIRQMLADNTPYFREDFLEMDVTEEIEATDTDREKAFGQIVTIDKEGNKRSKRRLKMIDVVEQEYRANRKSFTDTVLLTAEQNYKDGLISLDDLLEFRLGQMVDGRTEYDN